MITESPVGILLAATLTPLVWFSPASAQEADPPPAQTVTKFCGVIEEDYEPFTDVEGNAFLDSIECAAYAGIAQGGPDKQPTDHYGPRLLATRD